MALHSLNTLLTFPEQVAGWGLDDNQGLVALDIIGTNDGSLVNAPTWNTRISHKFCDR